MTDDRMYRPGAAADRDTFDDPAEQHQSEVIQAVLTDVYVAHMTPRGRLDEHAAKHLARLAVGALRNDALLQAQAQREATP